MDAKKNLNNTQRKMLDEIYTKSIDNKISEFISSRNKELAELKRAELDKLSKNKNVKAFLDAVEKSRSLYANAIEIVKPLGFEFNVSYSIDRDTVRLQEQFGYRSKLPKFVNDFHAETERKVSELRRIKDEIRLRVYGSDATYASIEAEINALLKGVL